MARLDGGLLDKAPPEPTDADAAAALRVVARSVPCPRDAALVAAMLGLTGRAGGS